MQAVWNENMLDTKATASTVFAWGWNASQPCLSGCRCEEYASLWPVLRGGAEVDATENKANKALQSAHGSVNVTYIQVKHFFFSRTKTRWRILWNVIIEMSQGSDPANARFVFVLMSFALLSSEVFPNTLPHETTVRVQIPPNPHPVLI